MALDGVRSLPEGTCEQSPVTWYGGALVSVFITATIGFLVVITILIVVQPKFPLDIGLVRTAGRAGLLVTALPAVVGVVGLFQLSRRRQIGSVARAR